MLRSPYCVLKCSAYGRIAEDNDIRSPMSRRCYQFFNFDLLAEGWEEEEMTEASATLQESLAATWNGGKGANRAEMMALALAVAGREDGRCFVLPDRGGDWATTRGNSPRYFVGRGDSIGIGSMGGRLREDWMCGEKTQAPDGHRVRRCKFPFKTDRSSRSVLNDAYRRLPTLATQELRKPHIDLAFRATCGRCLHSQETKPAAPLKCYSGEKM